MGERRRVKLDRCGVPWCARPAVKWIAFEAPDDLECEDIAHLDAEFGLGFDVRDGHGRRELRTPFCHFCPVEVRVTVTNKGINFVPWSRDEGSR